MISKPLFLDLESILVSKTSPKSWVSGSLFQPCCEYARSVIWNNPPIVLLYFSTLEASIFDFKVRLFHVFFRSCFWGLLFIDLVWILVEIWSQMVAKIHEKTIESWMYKENYKSGPLREIILLRINYRINCCRVGIKNISSIIKKIWTLGVLDSM